MFRLEARIDGELRSLLGRPIAPVRILVAIGTEGDIVGTDPIEQRSGHRAVPGPVAPARRRHRRHSPFVEPRGRICPPCDPVRVLGHDVAVEADDGLVLVDVKATVAVHEVGGRDKIVIAADQDATSCGGEASVEGDRTPLVLFEHHHGDVELLGCCMRPDDRLATVDISVDRHDDVETDGRLLSGEGGQDDRESIGPLEGRDDH